MSTHSSWATGIVAVVTGAAGAIGQEIVRALLEGGGRVLATDRHAKSLDPRLVRDGTDRSQLRCLAIDLLQPDSADKIVQAALDAFGELTALISNAGIGRSTYTRDVLGKAPRVWEVPPQAWDTMFCVNALAAIRLANAAVPALMRASCARMVFVTTSLDSMLNAGTGPYGPSKAAVEAYAAVLADELAGSSVTVNVLVPGGVVDSPMIPETPGVPRDRMLKPGVMVPPLRYLLSPHTEGVSAMRFRANLWDCALPEASAAQACGAPIAWSAIAKGQRRALT